MKHLVAICLMLALTPAALADPAERALELKLQQQLDALVGPGKSRVTVSGRSSEGSQSRSLQYGQVRPGREATVSETRSSEIDGRKTTTTTTRSERSYVYNQTEELRTRAPQSLEQKSVSVIFDPPASGEEASGPPVDARLVEDVVRNAAGIDESRGDHLSVQAARFDDSAYTRLRTEMEKQRQGTPWWLFALIGAAGLGLGIGTGLLLRRRRSLAARQAATAYAGPWPAAGDAPPHGYEPARDAGPVIQIRPEVR